MTSVTLLTPAKINLCLSVAGKRPDGYHDVEMLMQMVGLYDEVRIAVKESGISVACDSAAVPEGEGNIAYRAAAAILRVAGGGPGLGIEITKRIPVAAGLGGGSSNAAAVLIGVNRLLETGLGAEELSRIGVELGMDVPFFFYGPLARAWGRGDILTRIKPLPKFWVLLVNPGFETSTAWAYNNLNLRLTKKIDCNRIARLTVRNVAESLHNDLETVTAAAYPVITEITEALLSAGAMGARMSGSGPTVFGIFETGEHCRMAAETFAARGWRVFQVEALTDPPYAA